MGRLSTPKIRTSVAQIAANCIFEVFDFKIFRGRTPGTPKNAVTDYLHVEFIPPPKKFKSVPTPLYFLL